MASGHQYPPLDDIDASTQYPPLESSAAPALPYFGAEFDDLAPAHENAARSRPFSDYYDTQTNSFGQDDLADESDYQESVDEVTSNEASDNGDQGQKEDFELDGVPFNNPEALAAAFGGSVIDNGSEKSNPLPFSNDDSSNDEAEIAENGRARGQGRGRGRSRGRSRGRGRGLPRGRPPGRASGRPRGRTVPRGEGARGGGKGVKRGARKVAEPTAEFVEEQKLATRAYMAQRYDEAAEHCRRAIRINPEIFAAHSLLSQIFMDWGKREESLAVLWSGAHTIRDTTIWWEVANRTLALPDANPRQTNSNMLYNYSRILQIDRRDYAAHKGKLDIYIEQGQFGRAFREGEWLLRIKPHDLDVLETLAEIAHKSAEAVRAIKQYDKTIEHLQQEFPKGSDSGFSFSDLNIYIELYLASKDYERGLTVLKRLSRWLLNRGDESWWDQHQLNDSEWDNENEPRRIQAVTFRPGLYPLETYGLGLPFELRAKLGLLRLNLGTLNYGEALKHFEEFDPDDSSDSCYVFEYGDIFLDIADALSGKELWTQAIRFYKPLIRIPEHRNRRVYTRLAETSQALGDAQAAAGYYEDALTFAANNVDILLSLAKLYDQMQEPAKALEFTQRIINLGKIDKVKEARLGARRTFTAGDDVSDGEHQSSSASHYSDGSASSADDSAGDDDSSGDEDVTGDETDIEDRAGSRARKGPRGAKQKSSKATKPAKAAKTSKGPKPPKAPKAPKPPKAPKAPKEPKETKPKRGPGRPRKTDGSAKQLKRRAESKDLKARRISEKASQLREAAKARQQMRAVTAYRRYETVRDRWSQIRAVHESMREGVESAVVDYMSLGEELIGQFKSMVVFYPSDRASRFTGFPDGTVVRRDKALEEAETLNERLAQGMGIENTSRKDDERPIPVEWEGESFSSWLDLFCEVALLHAKNGDNDSSFEALRLASEATPFRHNEQFQTRIHAVALACSLLVRNEKRLSDEARAIIVQDRYSPEPFRLYAALHRVWAHDDDASWYRSGPSQKFLLRQVKAADYAVLTEEQRKRFRFSEAETSSYRFSAANRLGVASSIPSFDATAHLNSVDLLQGLDPNALLLYGHVLMLGGSWTNALNYYFRVLALKPGDALTLLSIAMAYLTGAVRRNTESRHFHILEGLSFFTEYKKARLGDLALQMQDLDLDTPHNPYSSQQVQHPKVKRQRTIEVHFNEGRWWHFLGLLHLAVPCYQRALAVPDLNGSAGAAEMEEQQQDEAMVIDAQEHVKLLDEPDFKTEAAFALQQILAMNGDTIGARALGEQYLVF